MSQLHLLLDLDLDSKVEPRLLHWFQLHTHSESCFALGLACTEIDIQIGFVAVC